MNTILPTVLALFFLPTTHAFAKPVAIHLAITGAYDEVDYDQYERMGERLAKLNPHLDSIRVRRARPSGPKSNRESFELREIDYELEEKMVAVEGPVVSLVVQAMPEDYDWFWKEIAAGRSPFATLRGRLSPTARVVFTGGEQDVSVDQARFLMKELGNTEGTLTVSTSKTHIIPSKRDLLARGLLLSVAFAAVGFGQAALTYIPREVIWPDFAVLMGTSVWVTAESQARFRFGRLKTRSRKTGETAFGMGEIFSIDQMARGFGLAATLTGLAYSGSSILTPEIVPWAVGFAALAAGTAAYFQRTKVLGLLAPKLFGINRARRFEMNEHHEVSAVDVSDRDLENYVCDGALVAI